MLSGEKFGTNPRTEIKVMAKKKLNISEKAEGILKIFGADELQSFATDVEELFEIFTIEDDLEDELQEEVNSRS